MACTLLLVRRQGSQAPPRWTALGSVMSAGDTGREVRIWEVVGCSRQLPSPRSWDIELCLLQTEKNSWGGGDSLWEKHAGQCAC